MGDKIRMRGYLAKEEFLTICNWKSRRPKNRYQKNTNSIIKEVTKKAFKEVDEKKKIETLTELQGIRIPTASAILSVIDPIKYPIIEKRCVDALISLGHISWTNISANSWINYSTKMIVLAKLTPREVDKAPLGYNRIKLDKEYKNLYKNYAI